MVALFLVMVIMQPQNTKGADVFTVGNWGTILHYADGAFTTKSTLFSTNTTEPSTVITLSSFTAVPSETKINTIDINWVTSSEIDTAGFNIYRDEAENGQYTAKLNPELIPSTGSSTNGVSYNFEDAPVTTGKTYYYKLEAIDLKGYKKTYGPVSARLCQTDADCDNGLFCDGEEKCQNDGSCLAGQSPCTQSQTCNETDHCISISSSTSTITPVSTTTTTSERGGGTSTTSTVSATTSIITTSTTSSVTTSTTTISPTSTTTTTQLSTTTIEPTTTTTTRSGPCAAEAIYGENAEETELLRKYRDNVLSKTPEGQEIIKTYYKFSPTVTELLEQRPLLKNRAKAFIDSMLPKIRKKVEESNKEP